MVSLNYLSKIVTARYDEILYFVREELKRIGRDGMLPEGAICVGGAVKARGFLELSRDTLKLPSFIGIPSSKDDVHDTTVNDPVFASVIGTLIFANKYSVTSGSFSLNIAGFWESIVKVFKKIIPR